MLPFMWKLKNAFFKLIQKKTFGARALVFSEQGVLLVKHSYTPKWYTIGGGIDDGETPVAALERELFEETGITCTKPPRLFGVYYNRFKHSNDYVALYIVKDFTQVPMSSPEITEAKWFELNALPDDISPATQRRIDEYLGRRSQEEIW